MNQDLNVQGIPGLQYLPEFVDAPLERTLLDALGAQPWRDDLQRRVQHYGYRYDYRARKVDISMRLGPLPSWLMSLAEKINRLEVMSKVPDQAIANEYEPGQGISRHIDCVPCFGPVIASLSLGSACNIAFSAPGGRVVEKTLERRSLLVLSGPARYDWSHCIPGRKSDMIQNVRVARSRRVSLTFRTVLLD